MSGAASEKKCCVPGCNKTRDDDIILHKFPNPETELQRFRNWVHAIGGDILALENHNIYKHRRVCHEHFEAKYHCVKKLFATAIPTLHLRGFRIIKGRGQPRKSLQDVTNQIQSHIPTAQEAALDPLPSTSKDQQMDIDISPIIGRHEVVEQIFKHDTQNVDSSTSRLKEPKGKHFNRHESEIGFLRRHIRSIQKSKAKYVNKLKHALKLSENPTFIKATQKFTAAAMILLMLQLREFKKDKMGRRFNKEEKVLSLALYKQGPRAYRFMRSWLVLPSPVTLSRMLTKANLRPGINENLFHQLKKRAKKMTNDEKLCVLLFDEMALSAHFDYNRKEDSITGFVDSGKKKSKKIADHALAFMIRGVFKNYKQPIAYTFCAGSTPKIELANQIKEIIKKLHDIGFRVLATVCDQGATNNGALNHLIQDTQTTELKSGIEWHKKTFLVDGKEVIPLFDPPHLLKCIRNHLITKDLLCEINGEIKLAKWKHIESLYVENPSYKGLRLVPKLTEYHVNPKKIPKMRVKYATQVLSTAVGVNMGYLAEKGILEASAKDTADVILFLDELFDSMNGSYHQANKGKPLLGPVTTSSAHEKFWQKAKKILASMKFREVKDNKETLKTIPTFKNWIQTLENIQILRKNLSKEYSINSVWLRHLNQDPLENFFGSIRSHGYRNNNPTCQGFQTAFTALLINNISSSHSPGSNCEKDTCHTIKSLNSLFFSEKSTRSIDRNNPVEFNTDDVLIEYENLENKKKNPKIFAPLEYVSGFVLRKAKSKVFTNCQTCKTAVFSQEKLSPYLNRREYSKNKKSLCYPSDSCINWVSKIQDVATYVLENDSIKTNIRNYIKTIICIDYSFLTCEKHKNDVIDYVEDYAITFFIQNWCKETNKILQGKKMDFVGTDYIQKMAHDYFTTRHKK